MKNTIQSIYTLALVASFVLLSSPIFADGPVIDPGGVDDPTVDSQNYKSVRYNPVSIEDAADVVSIIFSQPCGIVTITIKDAQGVSIISTTLNTSSAPSINFWKEGWNPGTYTIYVNNKEYGRVIAVK